MQGITHVELSRREYERLFRPVKGNGGMQSLLKKIQDQTHVTVILTEEDRERILRYVTSYGSGGWQQRLAGLLV